jgi:hypothetical protein
METKSNNTYEKAEKIKKNIIGFAEKSKETIRELIGSSSKQMENAMDSNEKIFNSIKKKLDIQEVDGKVADTVKHTFVKSLELAEDTFDAIINSYTRQMEHTVDFNTQLVEAVKESNPKNADKFLELIQENFERSQKLNSKNTKEILDFYNKHTNLTLNFNKTFSDNVNAQVEAMFQIQSKGFDRFTNWASDWWKQGSGEKEGV